MQGTEAASSLAGQGPQAVQEAEDVRAQAYGRKEQFGSVSKGNVQRQLQIFLTITIKSQALDQII